jgi:hypothetical protein
VAASAVSARTQEGLSQYSPIEGTLSQLIRMRPSMHDSSELEDAPRAMLSLIFRSRGDSSDGRAGSEGGVEVRLKGLILGAVLSLGGPSSSLGAGTGSAREGGSEGCTYRYSSLLRLSLYLSTVPESLLQTLIPALLRRGREWPKVILKAFSHLYSSRRIALDPRTSGSASNGPALPVTTGKSSLVRIVLEVRQLLLCRIKKRGRHDRKDVYDIDIIVSLIPLIPHLVSLPPRRSTNC